MSASSYRRFVGVGDSFIEGVGDSDPLRPNGVRGWADRVADVVAAHTYRATGEVLQYANLAIRGNVMSQIEEHQVERAQRMTPDLVALCAGINDIVRPTVHLDDLLARYERVVAGFSDTGARVVVFTAFDPVGRGVFSALRGRFAIYNELLREVADSHDATVVDFWRMREFAEDRLWDADRMHLSVAGHRRMTCRVLETLGMAPHDPPVVDDGAAQPDCAARTDNRTWFTNEALPWVVRRIRGVSRGDALSPRYPELTEWSPVLAES